MYNNTNITDEILQDVKLNNKKIDWKGRKQKSLALSRSYLRLKMYNKAERVGDCCSLLKFDECEHDGYKKLVKVNSCHDRLCSPCNTMRSKLLSYQLMQMISEVKKQGDFEYVFLTLTIPNVKGRDLSKAYDKIFSGFTRLFRYKRVDNMCVGAVRSLETTINLDKNSKSYFTYHPHLHVLIAVRPTYFKDKTYIRQAEWVRLWKKAMRVNFNPIVHIEKVKPRFDGKDGLMKAISEVAKYSVKDADYLYDDEKITDKVVKTLSYALKSRRLVGFTKLFKEIRAKLKLQDIESEDADLIAHTEHNDCCPVCGGTLHPTVYNWVIFSKDNQNYFKLDLSPDEIDMLFSISRIYQKRRSKIKKSP